MKLLDVFRFAPSSFLFLVVRPGAPNVASLLDARSPDPNVASFLLVAMPFVTYSLVVCLDPGRMNSARAAQVVGAAQL